MATRWEVERAVVGSELPPPARHVMHALCVVTEAGTPVIPAAYTPSLTTLATMTGLDRSTIRRQLNRLEKDGWVIRRRPAVADARSKKSRTRYVLTVPAGLSLRPPARGTVPPTKAAARGTLPPELGAENTMTRGTVPLNQNSQNRSEQIDPASLEQRRAARVDETVINAIRERTGVTVGPVWAGTVRASILAGRTVANPAAYIARAIRDEQDPRGRFLPPSSNGHAPANLRDMCRLHTQQQPCPVCADLASDAGMEAS